MVRYVLQNQLFNPPGVAFGEILDHDFRPGTGQNANGSEKQTVVDLNTGNIGVENEVVGTANKLTNAERNALIVELNLIAVDRIFETAAVKLFHCQS